MEKIADGNISGISDSVSSMCDGRYIRVGNTTPPAAVTCGSAAANQLVGKQEENVRGRRTSITESELFQSEHWISDPVGKKQSLRKCEEKPRIPRTPSSMKRGNSP